jgi:glyoxalase-like protein
MRLDHVIAGVRELDDAAVRLEAEHGLRFLRGGRHPGGTINSVAPLAPPQYLELLAVAEVGDPFTRKMQQLIDSGRTLLGWGIAVDDIDAIAARLGLAVKAGSITSIDGSVASWRFVEDMSDDSLPFFIAYDSDLDVRLRKWQDRVREAGNEGFGKFTFVEVGGDPERIRAVLGDADLPVRFVSGRPGLHAIGISGPTREIVLRETA